MIEIKLKSEESEWGDFYASVSVYHNGEPVLYETDRGEPEDQTFYRDWSWVPSALQQMYDLGKGDKAVKADTYICPDCKAYWQ